MVSAALSPARARPARPDLDLCARRLAAAGMPGGIDDAEPMDPGKVAIRLSGGRGFVKLALNPHAAALSRRELVAYAAEPPSPAFRRPVLLGGHDAGDWAALWLSLESGRAWPRRSALRPRAGPFEHLPAAARPVAAIMDRPVAGRFEVHRLRLLQRWADAPVRCGPAHGDFVYWNLLAGDGAPTLVDYEFFEPSAPMTHDRFQWTLLPLLRRLAAWGSVPAGPGRGAGWTAAVPALATAALGPLACALAPCGTPRPGLELALFLLRYGARIELQRGAPDLARLYAPSTQRLQDSLAVLLDRLLRGLLR